MINLNEIKQKETISKQNILNHINEYNIFRFYCGEFEINKAFLSPLRDEKNPSFSIFNSEQYDELFFKDYGLNKSGDFVVFVQLKFGLTYFEALSKIGKDFNLDKEYYCKPINTDLLTKNEIIYKSKNVALKKINSYDLKIKSRKWKLHDFKYWDQFGITYLSLKKYNVVPVDYIFYGDNIVKADKFAYAFKEYKDNITTYKIYQPFNKNYKWINNHNDSIWQGWKQLPEKGNLLIITKSLKDVMAITEICKVPAVSLQAESVKPKIHVINELKSRFKHIGILYDNDYNKDENHGRILAIKLSMLTDIPWIEINSSYKSKDFSDLVKNKSKEEAKQILNLLIEVIKLPF